MDFIKWMFGSFWRFLGVTLIVGLLFDGASEMFLSMRGKNTDCTKQAVTMQTPDGNSISLNISSDN